MRIYVIGTQELQDYLVGEYALNKFYPTFGDIAKRFGGCSTDTVFQTMKRVEKLGMVVRKGKHYRLSDELLKVVAEMWLKCL